MTLNNEEYFLGFFKSMAEMEDAYYNPNSTLRRARIRAMGKAADPILSDRNGYRNTLYGQNLWMQVFTSTKMLGLLPTRPWDKSGFRVLTSLDESSPGIAENAALPNPTAPGIDTVDVEPKECVTTMEISNKAKMLSQKDDSVRFTDIVEAKKLEFNNKLNKSACANAPSGAAGVNIESVDRIIASHAEADMAGVSADLYNIYNIDRSAAPSWADAQVISAATSTEGVSADGEITLELLNKLIINCSKWWDNEDYNNKYMVTGYDVLERIEALTLAMKREGLQPMGASVSINGVQTGPGIDAGIRVKSYNGIPIFCDGFMQRDTLSRVNLIDPKYIWFSTLQPAMYLEEPNFLVNKKLSTEAMFYLCGEIVCTKFAGQGKLRDLA